MADEIYVAGIGVQGRTMNWIEAEIGNAVSNLSRRKYYVDPW